MDRIEKYTRPVQRAAAAAAGFATIALAIMLTVGGVGRSAFSMPLKGDYEIVQLVLPWIIFLSFGYALLVEAHIRVTLLFDRFPVSLRLIIDILVGVAGILLCVLLIGGGYLFTLEAFVQHLWAYPGVLKLPTWIAWLALPLGLILMFFQYALGVVKDVTQLRTAGKRTRN